jgi:Bacterial pre-peptidase C-terminal domain
MHSALAKPTPIMTKSKIAPLLICCSVMFWITACKKDQFTSGDPAGPDRNQGLSGEALVAYNTKLATLQSLNPVMPASERGPVTYKGALCGINVSAAHATAFSLGDPQYWDYYEFSGNAGDEITILVQRTSPAMDPYAEIRLGTITDSDNWYGLMLVAAGDDNVDDPFNSCNNDPYIQFTLPESGVYTLGVADFISCGSPLTYQIITTGINCDTDGDGVFEVEDNCPTTANPGQENCDGDSQGDACDAHPCSNADATVNIGGFESNVPNVQTGGGSTMMDLILDCAANANTHGDFVSCVTQLAVEWKAAGLITIAQKNTIIQLAAGANIP